MGTAALKQQKTILPILCLELFEQSCMQCLFCIVVEQRQVYILLTNIMGLDYGSGVP